jgi:hypothetical protein
VSTDLPDAALVRAAALDELESMLATLELLEGWRREGVKVRQDRGDRRVYVLVALSFDPPSELGGIL